MYNSGNSSKNVTGASVVDGTLYTVDIADDAVTADKLANSVNTDIATGVSGSTTAGDALPKAGGAMTGAITTNSTFDGVDVATRDGILTTTTTTANAALPKAGGTMTGTIAGFESTGIDDNATSTVATLSDTGLHLTGNFRQAELVITTKSIDLTTSIQDLIQVGNRASYKITVSVGDGSGGGVAGFNTAYVTCSDDTATQGNITQRVGGTVVLSWKAATGTSSDAHTLQARVTSGSANQCTIMVETLSRYASASSGTGNGQSSIQL